MSREFFSIGGLFARWWPIGTPGVAPWVCASSVLTSGAIWDWLRVGGSVDFVLLGLAAYELVIGLTQEAPDAGAQRVMTNQGSPSSEGGSRSSTTH